MYTSSQTIEVIYIEMYTKMRIPRKIKECHQTVEIFLKRDAQNFVHFSQLTPIGSFAQSEI